jgi:D-sedoheptulose 7-phosphate isomerase
MDKAAVQQVIQESVRVKAAFAEACPGVIAQMCERCITCVKGGGTLFFCGNGGSFTDSLHIVGELVGRYAYDRPGLAAVTLGANAASLSAIGNDYGYADIFVREVDSLVRKGDVVIGLSTSGGSANVIKALTRAKEKGAVTFGWTGAKQETAMDKLCELVMHVPSTETPRIQECHIVAGHILAGAVEAALFPKKA